MSHATLVSRTALLATALVLLGAGCISVGGPKQQQTVDGSFFRTPDKGATWERRVALPKASGVGNIIGANVTSIAQSASYPQMLFLGTNNVGVVYSTDRGESWIQPPQLSSGAISSVAIHPADTCTSFVALGNKVLRSTDCALTYNISYVDARPQAAITSVVIDFYDPRRIYLSTSEGDLLRSIDGGTAWGAVQRFEDGIAQVVMSAKDSRILWVALAKQGLQRTTDAGETWTDLKKSFADFNGARTFSVFVEDRTAPGTLVHASRHGLLRSTDAGDSWTRLNTVTPPESANITALALNPKNGQEIYYAAGATLYASMDGGATWVTRRSPAQRLATVFQVDLEGKYLYLGMTKPKE